MSTRQIIEAFETWRARGTRLVMATVYATDGSTYSKAGHRILISESGDYRGLISGGCLEGDLAAQAHAVVRDGHCRDIVYDLRDEADEIWGMGIGCNGVIRVLMQALDENSGYEPFATIAASQRSGRRGLCATVVHSELKDLPVGATAISFEDDLSVFGASGQFANAWCDIVRKQGSPANTKLLRQDFNGVSAGVLYSALDPIPHLLIIGAGPDAEPMVAIARRLGWHVTVADHRQAAVEHDRLADADERILAVPGELAQKIEFDLVSAAIVMSHHLDTDRAWLGELMNTGIGYVGVLGAAERRKRLVSELRHAPAGFGKRLRGPVGLPIGADSPETIALSALAEIQQILGREA